MPPNHDDGKKPRVAASIPTNQKNALEYLAHERTSPGNRTYVAEIVAEAIEEYLGNNYEDLPPEARDLLDDDLRADGGKGGPKFESGEVDV